MQALYFNLDLTLTRMDRSFDAIVVEALAEAGVPDEQLHPSEWSDLFFDRFLALDPDPMEDAYRAYFERYDVDADPAETAALAKDLEVAAVEPAVEDLPGIVDGLREAYRVGVLTSGLGDLQRRKLAALGLADRLDDVVISYEVGATKESGGIFPVAERRLDAEAYVYCSNHDSDREAAREAGWRTVDTDVADLLPDPAATIRVRLGD